MSEKQEKSYMYINGLHYCISGVQRVHTVLIMGLMIHLCIWFVLLPLKSIWLHCDNSELMLVLQVHLCLQPCVCGQSLVEVSHCSSITLFRCSGFMKIIFIFMSTHNWCCWHSIGGDRQTIKLSPRCACMPKGKSLKPATMRNKPTTNGFSDTLGF